MRTHTLRFCSPWNARKPLTGSNGITYFRPCQTLDFALNLFLYGTLSASISVENFLSPVIGSTITATALHTQSELTVSPPLKLQVEQKS